MENYTVLESTTGYYSEKKSEFFACLSPASNAEEAKAVVEAQRKKRPDARHHCFAWRLADGSERAADDGEPQGTAGQPILEVLRKKNLTRCVLVVTRKFGGILLGASGLQRAYRTAAADAVESMPSLVRIAKSEMLRFSVPYALFPQVRRYLEGTSCRMRPPVFDAEVEITLSADPKVAESVLSDLQELTAGRLLLPGQTAPGAGDWVRCLQREAAEELLPVEFV